MAVAPGGVSGDRHVIYGLDCATVRAVLAARGHDVAPVLRDLERRVGPPAQIAVGKDGARAKLYWFLRGEDPYFLGVDLRPGRAPTIKHYRLLPPPDVPRAFTLLPRALHAPLEWLLEQLGLADGRLSHLVLLSRELPPRYTGVHVGLRPDWERLLARDRALLRRSMVLALLDQVGLSRHGDAVLGRLLVEPMAWTCYLSLGLEAAGQVGATVYVRADPVVDTGGRLALVEPGPDGARPRPVCLSVRLRDWPGVEVRMRSAGDPRCFLETNGWLADHAGPGPGMDGDTLVRAEFAACLRRVVKAAAAAGSPQDPIAALAALRADPAVAGATAAPDMRAAP